MALSPQEMQELAELEELEALEAEEASHASRAPALAPKEAPGRAKSASAGISQGLTMGYTPQIVGGLATLAGKAQDFFQGEVIDPATGKPIPRVEYTKARDSTNRQIDEAARANPGTYLAGNIAGSLAPGAGMAKLGKAATLGGRMGRATALGAAQGAAYNPGDKEGVVDPIQGVDRLKNAILGAGFGAAGQGLGELASKGAKTSKMVGLVKDESKLYDESAGQIKGAIKGINKKVVEPNDQKIRELIRGKTSNLDLDQYASVAPDFVEAQGQRAGSVDWTGVKGRPVPVQGEDILNLRQSLGKEGYKTKGALDGPTMIRNEEFAKASDSLRPHLTSMDKRVDPLLTKSSEAITLRDVLKPKLKKPISGLTTSADDNLAILSKVDEMAGSNLRGFGDDVSRAQDLLLDPSKLIRPLEAPNELRKIAVRGASSVGAAMDKAPAGTKESLAAALLETKRRAK